MLDPAITHFFEERKEAWLKKNLKASMDEAQIREAQQQCEAAFSLSTWLPSAAKRAGQISMATHPCTFSHPSARKNKNGYVSSVIAKAKRASDGFLRSGNVVVDTDALGNAAALDVYKFLTLEMTDGQQLLTHIQNDSEIATQLLMLKEVTYSELKAGFIAMAESDNENITSSKIKQVYFPVGDDYHQLSILTNSGMLYQLRKRIDQIRFGEEVKSLRDLKKKNEYSEQGFVEVYGLTTIGYGGTKPQNISVLNNQNGGKAHLLSSLPPQIEKRNIHFPRSDFFTESFRPYEYKDVFQALQRILKIDYKNNKQLRNSRDIRIHEIMDRIIAKMWAIRSVSAMQYNRESSQLSRVQKIWLHHEFTEERENTDDWLDALIEEISSWFASTYKTVMGKQAVTLGEEERLHILKMFTEHKEALR
ncbi:type I-F CRISPR-associated protein Csy1 [Shewanella electrodiphila]|uniref:Type I-F CRISPR-associated protein Csy1 n=1 Tax=Shewanella electrodiphila TaxID=934143 RepID=A0ABT0KVX7_9GAMM|nr:type I-F CRISPR-associated protein Csy1 [Shewanella electrodiphila]MCL1047540.1 type I-F CRISPR-associated protein Csy1 [Shewanella electrodiphila]